MGAEIQRQKNERLIAEWTRRRGWLAAASRAELEREHNESRPVSVKSMGDEDADAQYYKKCCNKFEHRQPSQNNNLGFNAMA
jgi:hypothetical protein